MNQPAFMTSVSSDDYVAFEVGTVNWLRQDDDVSAGIWSCTPEQQIGVHEAEFGQNETIYIIEGHVRVEIVDGPTFDLRAGDTAAFVKGTVGRWQVLEAVKEFFVYS
jgi:uncharacterized cupin superfamily protein